MLAHSDNETAQKEDTEHGRRSGRSLLSLTILRVLEREERRAAEVVPASSPAWADTGMEG